MLWRPVLTQPCTNPGFYYAAIWNRNQVGLQAPGICMMRSSPGTAAQLTLRCYTTHGGQGRAGQGGVVDTMYHSTYIRAACVGCWKRDVAV